MITLGLDPSLTGFGWCIHNSQAEGVARIVARGIFVTRASEIFIDRYVFLRESVSQIIAAHPEVEAVGVESPPFGALWSEGLYGLFLYVNEAIRRHRKDVVFFDPTSVKMLAKGDPKARPGPMHKSDMVETVRFDTGLTGRLNHNEADAYLVARSAARFWEFLAGVITERELTPAETQAFVKVHTFQRGAKAGQTVMQGAVYKENQRFFRFSQLP
jgi:Holliday junction resolvasome RuvABC endonuclease subunit